jgi:16S rRNA (cytosine967-C5)-methyltransferase
MSNRTSQTSDAFRMRHLFQLLEGYEETLGALDFYVSKYFRAHKSLGSKDRAFLNETLFSLVRWRGLLDYLIAVKGLLITWPERFALWEKVDPLSFLDCEDIPLYHRLTFPKDLFEELVRSWGVEKAREIALACNAPAPTTVRVNALKTDRESLLQRWHKAGLSVSTCRESSLGICFHKKMNFFTLPEFVEGLFEVQDEASQLVACLVKAHRGDRILDFCAGSGGKTLAFAPQLQGTGQIYLHDVRKQALKEAKKRLKRAGIQNAQCIHSEETRRLRLIKGNMDWVLVDVPCSGTGTLRRNPDMKWKFTQEGLARLVLEQRTIFAEGLTFLKRGGKIVYATCSILSQENQEQVAYFLEHHPITLDAEPFQSIPKLGEKDGFFAACFSLRLKPF